MKKIARTVVLALLAVGCTVDEAPSGIGPAPATTGAMVRWDIYHKPLPEIPFPNDQAMWPDPTSRTGLRVNASVVAPTNIEQSSRKKFDQLEGFGTYAPISVGFDKTKPGDARAAIDLDNIVKRHQGDDYDLSDDAIYVVNLDTGIPAIMDLGEGSFQYVIKQKDKYWRNDTRRLEQNLLWETADETIDPATGNQRPGALVNGAPVYKPEWDTDFDGVLDRPNLIDPTACPTQVDVALASDADRPQKERDRDRCLTDKMMSWYERETDSLIMRPLLPLAEKTQYAVVITDRLLDADGRPVRSPFDFVYHPSQEQAIARLESHLKNPKLTSYYGDIGETGLEHVVFAWTFTTQPVTEDLRLVRDGLYGHGPLAKLGNQFPVKGELARAAGPITLEAIADDAPEDPNWPNTPKCKLPAQHRYIVKFDNIKDTIRELAKSGFGFTGPQLETLLSSFDSIDYIAIGTFQTPFFITGGPKGTDPNASFDYDFQRGEGTLQTDTVQYMLAVPKATAGHKQPFPVAYYGHGYTSSSLEALGFAGHLAQQGIASVGMNAVFHGLDLGETDKKLALTLFSTACAGPFASAFLSGRDRDLDGDGVKDSGGDYWTSYLFHTRDVVRQSAIDLLQMFRTFKSFDGKRMSTQDYDDDGQPNLAGDFDGDGTPDIGGPNNEYYAWGQSLGGILAPFLAALDPGVVAAAPTSGSGGLLDVGARTFQGGAFEGIYLRNFGPLVVGVPAKDFFDAGHQDQTACSEDQISLRFVAVSVNNAREVEFNCVDKASYAKKSGGTVFVYNAHNGLTRCARMDKNGHFRIGIPSTRGDRLEVQFYDQPDAVDSYDGDNGCHVTLDASHRTEDIYNWGKGVIPQNGKDPEGKVVCAADGGCSKFENHYFAKGDDLVAIADGFGFIRQTPSLRRFMGLAFHIIDPGDPVNYAPYYAIHPFADPEGNPQQPKGVLNIVTVGDMNVPLNSGIALGRVAGALPFLTPQAAELYPAYADYVTPSALYNALGGKTPNRVLIDNHVMEGISRLERTPPAAGSCMQNEVPLTSSDVVCHPNCDATSSSACLDGQICINDRCQKPPVSDSDCAQTLYDVDVIDEGTSLYGAQHSVVPLRTGRIAMPATPDTLQKVWEPRLTGVPEAPDQGAWKADRRVLSQLMAYVEPRGIHGFDPSSPCLNWDSGQYLINLIGRFFASSGADVYYLSHPSTHECLAKQLGNGACPFLLPPP
jgi:hypothetical protein